MDYVVVGASLLEGSIYVPLLLAQLFVVTLQTVGHVADLFYTSLRVGRGYGVKQG